MKKETFFLKTKKILPVILILLLGAYCSKGLFTYHFFSTHDGDHHLARSYDAVKTLSEGHFPLRWAGSLNYFCGIPIFNFFYPLFYYLIFLINLLVGDIIFSLKIVYVLSFTLAPLFFYLWLKRETKNTIASLSGAILYLFVPYRFLLVFVRSSPEFMAYTVLPVFLYLLSIFFEKVKKKERNAAYLFGFLTSLSGAALITAHQLIAFLLFPIIFLWFVIKTWQAKVYKQKVNFLWLIFLTAASIVGLSAFFWGPVFLEKGEVKIGELEIISYWQHFPSLKQLIHSPWGYFYSAPGIENDGMSFSLGYAQWAVLGLSGIWLVIKAVKTGLLKTVRENFGVLFFFLISVLALFLMLEQSRFIWELFVSLQEVQFPWRFLGVTSFTVAALGGFWLTQIGNKKIAYALAILISFLAIYGNRNHLLPQPLAEPERYEDFERLHPHRYSTTTLGDDILNREAKKACYFDDPFLLVNKEKIENKLNRGNTFGEVYFKWPQQETAVTINLNLEYFPGIYKIKINGEEIKKISNFSGRIALEEVNLKEGENAISWQIVQSPIERFFNGVSLGFLVFWLILIPIYEIKRKV